MAALNITRCLKLCLYDFWPFNLIKGTSPPYVIEGTIFEYVMTETRAYGIQLPNGTWTGMMGLLTRQEVDMSGVVFSQHESRVHITIKAQMSITKTGHMVAALRVHSVRYGVFCIEFQFLGPFMCIVFFAIARIPELPGMIYPERLRGLNLTILEAKKVRAVITNNNHQQQESTTAITNNNHQQQESSTVITNNYLYIVPVTALCFFFLLFRYRVWQQEGSGSVTGTDQHVAWRAFLWTLASTLSQGSTWWPRASSVRIMAGTWLLMAFILSSIYRSNLMAMLTLPKLRLPFNNAEELARTSITLFTGAENIMSVAIQVLSDIYEPSSGY
nr:uncharacterized protein LOC128703948 [Cherax quadricarinatus]